jgi:hypothetical protein
MMMYAPGYGKRAPRRTEGRSSPRRRRGTVPSARLAVVLLLAALTGGNAVAESSRGGTFLPMGWSARGAGLGGAASILIRDDRSGFWNPANVSFLMSPRITLGTTRPVPGLDNWYTVLSAGTGLLDVRTAENDRAVMRRVGIAVTATHLGLELAQGSGWNEGTLGLSFAFAPNHFNSLGVTFRMMKSWNDLDDAGAWGTAVDAGWTAILTSHLWLALVGRNIHSSVSYPNVDEQLDPTFTIAAALEDLFGRISIETDAVMKNGGLDRVLVGSEIDLMSGLLRVSGGAELRLMDGERTIPCFGVGSTLNSIEAAVAFLFDPEDAFGRQTRASVSYLF